MTIYHIIDHAGFGTIHKLLYPLQEAYACHKVFVRKSSEEFIDETRMAEIISDKEARIIVHSTGNLDKICRKALAALSDPMRRGFIFLHTSYEYQKIKGREDMAESLRELQDKYHYFVLTPSKEVADQYRELGIKAGPVQLGIPGNVFMQQSRIYRDDLAQYYDRYITTCSSEKEIYRQVKGVDRFIKLVQKYGLEKEGLIAGIARSEEEVEAVRFDERDFLNVLCHSKAYIQLSRFESYNLTAAWAKQFRVPVLVLGVEGTWSSMGQYAMTSQMELEENLKQIIDGTYPEKVLEECYQDSIERESLEAFHRSITEILKLANE